MLVKLLELNHMSIYECSKKSGIPYSTLFDLVHSDSKIKNCSASTLYKLAKVLNTTMENLIEGRI